MKSIKFYSTIFKEITSLFSMEVRIKKIICIYIGINIGNALFAQTTEVYQLPIFEVAGTEKTVIGVKEGDGENAVYLMANRKRGVYLSNPFATPKKITHVNMEFKQIKSKIKRLRIEIYPARLDSFPDEVAIFDTTVVLSWKNKNHQFVKTPELLMPKNGVVVAYNLITNDGEILGSKKTGCLQGKKFKERHRISFDYYEGKWRRIPFEEWNDGSVIGNLTMDRTKIVPVINLTLVN